MSASARRGLHRTVALGGTFDRLHAGHRALFRAAFRLGDTILIGVTTDAYLATHQKPGRRRIASYARRRHQLADWLRQEYPGRRWAITALSDSVGKAAEAGVDVLVASAETASGAAEVNRLRRERGLPPLDLRLVPLVLGDDGLPLSSRRIRAGEIDPDGHRLTPIRLRLDGPDARAALVKGAFAQRRPDLQFTLPRRSTHPDFLLTLRRASGNGGTAANGALLELSSSDGRRWSTRAGAIRLHDASDAQFTRVLGILARRALPNRPGR
ncbi:MAG: pantetheine-phosphate adenylyltransferase [Thermoplasmata archaeon]|nr:pantetheine-phosphate adenylyltransferase [Thermoplasmata archaeon]